MLKKLYVDDSLTALDDGGFSFELQNSLATSTITGPPEIQIDGTPVDVTFETDGEEVAASDISEDDPYDFEKGDEILVRSTDEIDEGAHTIKIETPTDEWDTLEFEVEDTL
jgi:hypothetical protein